MSFPDSTAPGTGPARIPSADGSALARSAMLCVLVLAIAPFWQWRWGVIPDTSWLIAMCEQVLAGQRLYVDLVETNPPFSIWLYLPPVALAHAVGASPEVLVHAWTYLAMLAGLGFAGLLVRRGGFPESAAIFKLAPAFLALLVIYPGMAFSQREHIGVALLLPLLVLMAWRASADAPRGPGIAIAVLAGLCGSVIVLVKPHYAVLILAPALYAAWLRRSALSLFAVEFWAIGFVCLGYLGAVLWLYPQFVRDMVPLLSGTYMLVRADILLATVYLPLLGVLFWLIRRFWLPGGTPELARVAFAASTAAILPLFAQGKGWSYHAYPALSLGVMTLLLLLAARQAQEASVRAVSRKLPSPALAAAVIIATFAPFFSTQKPPAAMVEAIREAVLAPRIALIGDDLTLGHPLARMVGGSWISAYCADWLGTSALRLGLVAEKRGDGAEAARYRAMLERYAAVKKAEILESEPDLLIIDKEQDFWTGHLAASHGFGPVLERYGVLWEDERLRIMIRDDTRSEAVRPDASPASM